MAELLGLQSRNDILTNLKAKLKETLNNASQIEGSFNSDMLKANAIEFEKVYAEIELVIDAAFADSSWGKYLTMRAAEFGVDRKIATKAKGYVTCNGNAGAKIIKGSLFATKNDIKFYTTVDNVIGANGLVTCEIEAAEVGSSGIVLAGTITEIPMSIPSVNSVTNDTATKDGFDEETDEALLERYLLKVRTPATSGNKYHYLNWAKEVTGVGNAKVFPLWHGAGTVKVVIVDSNNNTASNELINEVSEHIEEYRPIGATVTVTTAQAKKIDIAANINGSIDIEELKEKIIKYFKSLGFTSEYVSFARIGKELLECNGVDDYSELKINNQTENINLTIEELPVLGQVLINVD